MKKVEILELLKDFIAIESVSTDPKRFPQILKASEFLKKNLESFGCDVKVFQIKDTPPLIIGLYSMNKKAKTIGIYGHYDVQPEDPLLEWRSPPFKLTQKDGKLYARGVADTKGHVIQNIVAIKNLIHHKKLHNNIIFIFEGGEEISSYGFEKYARNLQNILSMVDVFYIVDLGMPATNEPTISFGLRGIVTFELEIKIGEVDLHSGTFGNRVLNPIHVISYLISQMKNLRTNKVLIPRFYDNIKKPSKKEFTMLKKGILSVKEEMNKAHVFKIITIDDIPPSIVTKIMPSLDFNGVSSGYTGEGFKTVIGSTAILKFSCRLVAEQTPSDIIQKITNFIKHSMPSGVIYNLNVESQASPVRIEIKNDYIQKAAKALAKVFRAPTSYTMTGGSVPAAEILYRLYKKPMVMFGFPLPDSQIHAPNENVDEDMFWKGIKALEEVYQQ